MIGSGLASGFGSTFLLVLAAAFPIVNPAGSALIFLDITRHLPHKAREALARRIAFYGFLVLSVSLSVGSYLLAFFGISIPVLRVAGGIVVAAAGWKFLQQRDDDDEDGDAAEEATGGEKPSLGNYMAMAFYPLTMPITTGPGSISVMIALGTSDSSDDRIQSRLEFLLAGVVANAVLAAFIYVCFAFADRVRHVLGNTGTTIALRLMAFILFCIGLQILWTGVSELIDSVGKS